MRVPPALMWWEVRTVSPVPATLDTLEMVSLVWVSIAVFFAVFLSIATCMCFRYVFFLVLLCVYTFILHQPSN